MTKKFKGSIIVLIVLGVLSIPVTIWSHYTKANSLEEKIEAQYQSNQVYYDNMWKSFKEMAQVTDLQAEQMKDVYTSAIKGRYEDDATLIKMVKEDNPKMDDNMYSRLENHIATSRSDFANKQKVLTDIISQYNAYIRNKPIMKMISGKETKDSSKYVTTSSETQNAFKSGEDDEINIREK